MLVVGEHALDREDIACLGGIGTIPIHKPAVVAAVVLQQQTLINAVVRQLHVIEEQTAVFIVSRCETVAPIGTRKGRGKRFRASQIQLIGITGRPCVYRRQRTGEVVIVNLLRLRDSGGARPAGTVVGEHDRSIQGELITAVVGGIPVTL